MLGDDDAPVVSVDRFAEVAAEITGQGVLAGEKALQEQIGALRAQVGELTERPPRSGPRGFAQMLMNT